MQYALLLLDDCSNEQAMTDAARQANPINPQQILSLLESEPQFTLPAHLFPNEQASLEQLKTAHAADPTDVALLVKMFLCQYRGDHPDLPALSYLQQALAIAPAYGKAIMFYPLAAPVEEPVLNYSELACALLPGNSFATTQHLAYLQAEGRPVAEMLPLAQSAIESDPHNPDVQLELISLLHQNAQYQEALTACDQLVQLLESPLNERTEYCLHRNPQRSRDIQTGQFDPLQDALQIREQITAEMNSKSQPDK